jgi:putative SOS response-associated peptidase YedK
MCGRYTLAHSTEEIVDRFGLKQLKLPITARYNIAPSQLVPIIIANQRANPNYGATAGSSGVFDDGYLIEAARWGFVPSWSRDLAKTPPMINARAESASEKPTFRTAFRARRCIIPADSFYEWQGEGKNRKPWRFHLKGEELFGFAGLFEDWSSTDGDEIRTCAILTVGANALMQQFHDRMPVILPRQLESRWLDPTNKDVASLEALLRPYPADLMALHRVSTAVNGTKLDVPELVRPVDPVAEAAAQAAQREEARAAREPKAKAPTSDKPRTKAAARPKESPGQLSLFNMMDIDNT